jgi:formate dehydrogenase maturation protein FdhE
MTKDGLAVPIVDELAAVSLDLWAADNGYQKLTPNLAGV